MPLLFLGLVFFLLMSLVWLFWAIAALFWPVALVIVGAVLLRRQMRYWNGITGVSGDRPPYAARARFTAPDRNSAFEDHRRETLHHLDEERSKFRDFVERLRKSRDREEFDRFIAERRTRIDGPMRGQSPAV